MKYNRKSIIIAFVLLLIPVFVVGYNYFSKKEAKTLQSTTLTVDGNFIQEEITVKETIVPGDDICNAINFNITSTAPSWLRVKAEVKADGQAANEKIATFNLVGDNWQLIEGYYYYKKEVSQIPSLPFVSSIKFEGDESTQMNNYQNKQIDVMLTMELVQSEHDAYVTAWGIDADDAKYSFLKK